MTEDEHHSDEEEEKDLADIQVDIFDEEEPRHSTAQ